MLQHRRVEFTDDKHNRATVYIDAQAFYKLNVPPASETDLVNSICRALAANVNATHPNKDVKFYVKRVFDGTPANRNKRKFLYAKMESRKKPLGRLIRDVDTDQTKLITTTITNVKELPLELVEDTSLFTPYLPAVIRKRLMDYIISEMNLINDILDSHQAAVIHQVINAFHQAKTELKVVPEQLRVFLSGQLRQYKNALDKKQEDISLAHPEVGSQQSNQSLQTQLDTLYRSYLVAIRKKLNEIDPQISLLESIPDEIYREIEANKWDYNFKKRALYARKELIISALISMAKKYRAEIEDQVSQADKWKKIQHLNKCFRGLITFTLDIEGNKAQDEVTAITNTEALRELSMRELELYICNTDPNNPGLMQHCDARFYTETDLFKDLLTRVDFFTETNVLKELLGTLKSLNSKKKYDYSLAQLTDEIESEPKLLKWGKLYVRMCGNRLKYAVISPFGERVIGEFEPKELKHIFGNAESIVFNPFRVTKLTDYLSRMLDVTSKRGHTEEGQGDLVEEVDGKGWLTGLSNLKFIFKKKVFEVECEHLFLVDNAAVELLERGRKFFRQVDNIRAFAEKTRDFRDQQFHEIQALDAIIKTLNESMFSVRRILANLKKAVYASPNEKEAVFAIVNKYLNDLNLVRLEVVNGLAPCQIVEKAIEEVKTIGRSASEICARIIQLNKRLSIANLQLPRNEQICATVAAELQKIDNMVLNEGYMRVPDKLNAYQINANPVKQNATAFNQAITNANGLKQQLESFLKNESTLIDMGAVEEKLNDMEYELNEARKCELYIAKEKANLANLQMEFLKQNRLITELCRMFVDAVSNVDHWRQQVKMLGGEIIRVDGQAVRVPTAIAEMFNTIHGGAYEYRNWQNHPAKAFALLGKLKIIATDRMGKRPDDSCSFFARRRDRTSMFYTVLINLNFPKADMSDACIHGARSNINKCNIVAVNSHSQLRVANT